VISSDGSDLVSAPSFCRPFILLPLHSITPSFCCPFILSPVRVAPSFCRPFILSPVLDSNKFPGTLCLNVCACVCICVCAKKPYENRALMQNRPDNERSLHIEATPLQRQHRENLQNARQKKSIYMERDPQKYVSFAKEMRQYRESTHHVFPPHHGDKFERKCPSEEINLHGKRPNKETRQRKELTYCCRGSKTDNVGNQHVVAISYVNDKT